MRPTNAKRKYTIALSIYGDSRPNKRDCYTRHPFFENRFDYDVYDGRIVFKNTDIKGRKFSIDKAGAYKGDISVKDFPAGEYTLHYDSTNNQYFIESLKKPLVKSWNGNLFSAQGVTATSD